MKRTVIWAIALSVLIGCSSKKEEEKTSKEKAVKVTTVTVKQESIVEQLRYSGTILAYQTIPLSFEGTGVVKQVLVDAGDRVTEGQLLAIVDDTDAKNMYQMTLAKYQQAQDAYDRLKSVYEKGSLPEIKWVEMESNLAQAKSSLELSKNNLDKCKLYSPVNGVVGKRNTEPGMSALSITSAPLEIVDIKKVYVKISIPENEVVKISKGMKAGFKVSAIGNGTYYGTIANISPVADQISRTYEAKILVDNPNMELKPGMVCDVQIEEKIEHSAIMVPYQSITKDDTNNAYVFVVDTTEERVKKQVVETGQYWGSNLEIVTGLTPGQIIVTGGKEKLSDNALIAL